MIPALLLAGVPNLFFLEHCIEKGALDYVCTAMSRQPLRWAILLAMRALYMWSTPFRFVELALLGQVAVAYIDDRLRAKGNYAMQYVHYAYSAVGPALALVQAYSQDLVSFIVAIAALLAYLVPFVLDLTGVRDGASQITQLVEALVLVGHFGMVGYVGVVSCPRT